MMSASVSSPVLLTYRTLVGGAAIPLSAFLASLLMPCFIHRGYLHLLLLLFVSLLSVASKHYRLLFHPTMLFFPVILSCSSISSIFSSFFALNFFKSILVKLYVM
jgi:hypothetical protein